MSDISDSSPCTTICKLNEEDICIGCYRTADEIRDWSYLDNEQRLNVLLLCGERNLKNNPFY